MLRQVSGRLYRVTNAWSTLGALVVFLLFGALVLPRQAALSSLQTADAGSPDTSLWYSADELYHMAEAYGPLGRQAYVRARFTFDLVWPVVYGAFLATAISWFYARGFVPGSRWRLANVIPVLGMLFDYLENLATSAVMWRYPNRTPVLALLAPLLTLVKWAFVGASFPLLAVGLVTAAWQWMSKRSNR